MKILNLIFLIFAIIYELKSADIKELILSDFASADSIKLLANSGDPSVLVGYTVRVTTSKGFEKSFSPFIKKCDLEQVPHPDLTVPISSLSYFTIKLTKDLKTISNLSYIGGFLFWTKSEQCLLLTHDQVADIPAELINVLKNDKNIKITSEQFVSAMDAEAQKSFLK